MIPARFLPARLCRWLRNRKARKWARIRARDADQRRARWTARYLSFVNVKSEFPR